MCQYNHYTRTIARATQDRATLMSISANDLRRQYIARTGSSANAFAIYKTAKAVIVERLMMLDRKYSASVIVASRAPVTTH